MGDLFAVDVSLDLPREVPATVLTALRHHLAPAPEDDEDAAVHAGDDEDAAGCAGDPGPFFGGRGPAYRIGGVVGGELLPAPRGWALTVRQEIHAELLDEVVAFVGDLVAHTTTPGVVGQVRFYEDEIPELLVNRAGTLLRIRPVPPAP
ncbi:hypothetical protein [Streptomyces sp. t39]|uniref:hypothetical protein n=1 Tax=Streptomyces sp. t39 TaxID=1828156 RepID=UPI0011CE5CD7|nr:hypothetical protein [Streptomyces sp. t39]TXS54944.1 hypothetical protein EAO77_00990 [Streptomyces sp. t39]